MCGPALLNGDDRARIAAFNATFRQVSVSPFGEDDEIGMLNLMDSESIQRVLSEADYGKIFDLAVDYFIGMPSFTGGGDLPFQQWMSHTPSGNIIDDPLRVGKPQNELVGYSGDCIAMYTHCGTHIDTLNHFGYRGQIWNGFSEKDHLGNRHWNVAGADKYPPIISRGVLIDVAALHGVDMLPESYGIGERDLNDALRHQGSSIRTGDVVMIRTGRMTMWPTPEYVTNEPGINREGAKFLAEAGAMVIGSDNLGVEQMPAADPENWEVVHTYLFSEAGVPILEVANLEELAVERVYEFAFVGACLRIRGATGSPIRPIAIPLRT
ncbi:MAG: cyclase family protein [Chloroflexota bacterium]